MNPTSGSKDISAQFNPELSEGAEIKSSSLRNIEESIREIHSENMQNLSNLPDLSSPPSEAAQAATRAALRNLNISRAAPGSSNDIKVVARAALRHINPLPDDDIPAIPLSDFLREH